MNRHRLLALLVILALLAGGIGRVPVARGYAANSFTGAMYGNIFESDHTRNAFFANADHVTWTGYYAGLENTLGYGAGVYSSLSMSFTVDGVEKGLGAPTYALFYTSHVGGGWSDNMTNFMVTFIPQAGSHAYAWQVSGYKVYGWVGQYVSWIGSVAGYDTTVWGGGYPGGSEPGPGVYPGDYTPLAVTIDSGPTSVDFVNGGTWHAAATGGTTPYTYYWDWAPLGGVYHYNTPFDPVGPTGTDTYSHTWNTAGTYTLQCMVQDAVGTWADATYQVSAASVPGSYHAFFGRYGDKGQYLNVQVDDAAGNPVTISSTAGTQYGLYEAGGAFGWFAADSEAAQLVTYTWRWVMSYTVTPPGLALPPPADFWIETSIHLAVPNIDLAVTHHFTSLAETWDPWFGPTGNQLTPETAPSETSTLPDWLQPVYDMFVRLLRFLFVPSASDFSAQLASGWILIASPVPSITPQYTIPFPNPQHLLAETGDSVNIDFSGIQAYSGYATYKAIVQAILDALLLFLVISLVA